MIYREPSVSARSPRARFFHDSIQWEDRIHSGFWWTCYRGANSWREDDIFISFVASIQPHIGPPSIDPVFEIKKKNIKKREERERSDTHDRIELVVYKPDFLHVSLQDKKLTISAIASFIFVVRIIWPSRCYKNSLISRKNRFSTISARNDFHDIDYCKNCSFYLHHRRNLVFKLLLSNC